MKNRRVRELGIQMMITDEARANLRDGLPERLMHRRLMRVPGVVFRRLVARESERDILLLCTVITESHEVWARQSRRGPRRRR